MAQATQQWSMEMQVTAPVGKQAEEPKDLMDFIKQDNTGPLGQVRWQDNVLTQPMQAQEVSKASGEEAWKQDPRIQALIVDRMQQIEADAKQETIQGKRKRSDRFNTTDSSNSIV